MVEFEYFERFKALGKYLAYSEIVDTINELKQLYREEAKQGFMSLKETEHIINVLDILSGSATIKGREALKKC